MPRKAVVSLREYQAGELPARAGGGHVHLKVPRCAAEFGVGRKSDGTSLQRSVRLYAGPQRRAVSLRRYLAFEVQLAAFVGEVVQIAFEAINRRAACEVDAQFAGERGIGHLSPDGG